MAGEHTRDWITFGISVLAMALTVGITCGAINNRVSTLEEVVKSYSADHDILIRISEKIDTMQKDIKEIKTDMKKHLEK